MEKKTVEIQRESEKPQAIDNPGPQPIFKTPYDKINHLQQQIDVKNKEIKHLREDLELCHEKIMKLSQK